MTVALIPVRGGSKSIPLKNIKSVCGKPLVYWTMRAACECEDIEIVYVATDSGNIKTVINDFCETEPDVFSKAIVIDRDSNNATDTASTESVMLEFAGKYMFDDIVLIQATSPLLTGADLHGGINLYSTAGTDSVLSVVKQKRFLWSVNDDGTAKAINYDYYDRPRRQDFDGYYVENGAFYITSRSDLLKYKNRLSGTVKAYVMREDTALEIDEPNDFKMIEVLLRERFIADKKELHGTDIKMVVMDCDGCLTDGGMYYSENGDELKKFNTKDGMAVSKLKRQGIIVGIVTGESVKLNRRRAKKLNMDFLEMGCKNKVEALDRRCKEYGIEPKNVLYIGDDINDLEAMRYCGLSACPADAIKEVLSESKYVSVKKGGAGAVRDIVDTFLFE